MLDIKVNISPDEVALLLGYGKLVNSGIVTCSGENCTF